MSNFAYHSKCYGLIKITPRLQAVWLRVTKALSNLTELYILKSVKKLFQEKIYLVSGQLWQVYSCMSGTQFYSHNSHKKISFSVMMKRLKGKTCVSSPLRC